MKVKLRWDKTRASCSRGTELDKEKRPKLCVLSFLPKISFTPIPDIQEALFRLSWFLNNQWAIQAVSIPWFCLVESLLNMQGL